MTVDLKKLIPRYSNLVDWATASEFARDVRTFVGALVVSLSSLQATVDGIDESIATDLSAIEAEVAALDVRVTALETGPGTLVWAWNRTDTSQFNTTAVWTSGLTSSAISVISSSTVPGGNALRVQIVTPSSGTAKAAHFRVLTDLPPGRYRFEAVVIANTATSGAYGGLWFLGEGSSSSHYSYATLGGNAANYRYRVDAGSIVDAASGNGAPWQDNATATDMVSWEFAIDSEKIGGGAARFTSHAQSQYANLSVRGSVLKSANFTTASPAGWNALSSEQWGVALRHLDSSSQTINWDFADLRVYRA